MHRANNWIYDIVFAAGRLARKRQGLTTRLVDARFGGFEPLLLMTSQTSGRQTAKGEAESGGILRAFFSSKART